MPGKPTSHYPIRAVSRMTGLSLDTLRAWERRYAAVTPRRGDRGRVYTDADVARLRTLGGLVASGHAIGTIAHLDERQLTRLLENTLAPPTTPSADQPTAPLDEIVAALDAYDLSAIEQSLSRFAVVLAPRDLIIRVVLPLLAEIGDRWQAGTLRPAQEHLVSAIVRSVLGGLLRTLARVDATPRVVFATPSGERHELGLLSAAVLAAAEGFGVVYLGADLPAAEVWDAAVRAGAGDVIISLTTPHAVGRSELRAWAQTPVGLTLWIGGPRATDLLTLVKASARHIPSLTVVPSVLTAHAR